MMAFLSTLMPCARSMLAFVALTLLLLFNSASGFQKPGGRPTATPTPTPKPPKGPTTPSTDPKVVPEQRFANMTIMAPIGCRVWINNVEVEMPQTGILTRKSVKPGPHLIVARKPDFRDYSQQVDVLLDQENVFSIILTPLPAKLTVSPSIGGAEVDIFNLETSQSVGHYFHQLNQVDLVPGRYRISTSKNGYRVSMREITARPGESIYLEPLLEPLPTPTPTPRSALTIRNIPMTFDIRKQDKYLVLRLQGSSGDTAKIVGSVNVSLGGPANNYVSGNFNGLPCRVEFVKLENIAEGSIVEAPGPWNNWSAIVVRIRPKDEKRRPISFAINWSTLENTPLLQADAAPDVFIPAVAIQKVQPPFPPEARGSPISGTVSVLVAIDSAGSVISAKAIDGPYNYRRLSEEAARKWKFRPATRDGRSVESQQTIQFRFER
jgi:TonB family protein